VLEIGKRTPVLPTQLVRTAVGKQAAVAAAAPNVTYKSGGEAVEATRGSNTWFSHSFQLYRTFSARSSRVPGKLILSSAISCDNYLAELFRRTAPVSICDRCRKQKNQIFDRDF